MTIHNFVVVLCQKFQQGTCAQTKEEDMSSYTEGQVHQLMERLEREGFAPSHITKLGQFSNLCGIRDVLDGFSEIKPMENFLVRISRTFDPVKFLGEGWSIVEEETDKRSAALTEFRINDICFGTMLKGREASITGEERLRRLKEADFVRLDADTFLTFWENKSLIPKSWKEKVNGNTRFIFFDGTVLRNLNDYRCVLHLCWYDGEWHWSCHWLNLDCGSGDLSAVLAS